MAVGAAHGAARVREPPFRRSRIPELKRTSLCLEKANALKEGSLQHGRCPEVNCGAGRRVTKPVLRADGKHLTAFLIYLTALPYPFLQGVSLLSVWPALWPVLRSAKRLFVFGRTAWCERIGFRLRVRSVWRRTRLLIWLIERLAGGIGDGINGGIGLHDGNVLLDGNASRRSTRNEYSRNRAAVAKNLERAVGRRSRESNQQQFAVSVRRRRIKTAF